MSHIVCYAAMQAGDREDGSSYHGHGQVFDHRDLDFMASCCNAAFVAFSLNGSACSPGRIGIPSVCAAAPVQI